MIDVVQSVDKEEVMVSSRWFCCSARPKPTCTTLRSSGVSVGWGVGVGLFSGDAFDQGPH